MNKAIDKYKVKELIKKTLREKYICFYTLNAAAWDYEKSFFIVKPLNNQEVEIIRTMFYGEKVQQISIMSIGDIALNCLEYFDHTMQTHHAIDLLNKVLKSEDTHIQNWTSFMTRTEAQKTHTIHLRRKTITENKLMAILILNIVGGYGISNDGMYFKNNEYLEKWNYATDVDDTELQNWGEVVFANSMEPVSQSQEERLAERNEVGITRKWKKKGSVKWNKKD